jgi:5'-deoxynucleotidase YfbR-like HD superfamily hydrolase
MNLDLFLSKRDVLSSIKRFNMDHVNRPQNLCDHGYNVGTLFYLFCQECNVDLSAKELFLVMNHDFLEAFTGDLNKKIKDLNVTTKDCWQTIERECSKNFSEIYEYTDKSIKESFTIIKRILFELADSFDAFLYCIQERKSGNLNLKDPEKYYHQKCLKLQEELELLIPCEGYEENLSSGLGSFVYGLTEIINRIYFLRGVE